MRDENNLLDKFGREERNSFQHHGDYIAGEDPDVDRMGYRLDSAPYPRHWDSDRRVEMTWWAQRENVKVDYDPDAPDGGASGWEAAWASMQRVTGMNRSRIADARARAASPGGTLPAEPEPAYVDPGEPRHPRDEIGGW
jgi:hypothetical protein